MELNSAGQRLSRTRVSLFCLFYGRSILRLEMLQNWCYHLSDLAESYECCFMHLIVLQYAMHHTIYTLIMCFLKPPFERKLVVFVVKLKKIKRYLCFYFVA